MPDDKCPECDSRRTGPVDSLGYKLHPVGGIDCLHNQLAKLKAENERLTGRLDAAEVHVRDYEQAATTYRQQRDQLKAENEKLRTIKGDTAADIVRTYLLGQNNRLRIKNTELNERVQRAAYELARLHAMEQRVKEINPAIDKEGNLVLVITSKPPSNLCWRTIQAQLLGDGNETKETQ